MGAWGHAEGRRGHAGPPFATPRDRISPHPRSGRGFAGHGRQTPGQNDNEASGPPNPSLAVTGSRSTYVLAPDLGPVWAANRAPVRSGPVGRLMPSPPVTGSRPDLVLSTTRRRPIRSRAVRSRRLERPRRPVARPHGPVPASFGRAGRPEAPDEQSLDGRAVVPVAEVHGGHRGAPLTPRGKCEPAGEDHESNGQVGRRPVQNDQQPDPASDQTEPKACSEGRHPLRRGVRNRTGLDRDHPPIAAVGSPTDAAQPHQSLRSSEITPAILATPHPPEPVLASDLLAGARVDRRPVQPEPARRPIPPRSVTQCRRVHLVADRVAPEGRWQPARRGRSTLRYLRSSCDHKERQNGQAGRSRRHCVTLGRCTTPTNAMSVGERTDVPPTTCSPTHAPSPASLRGSGSRSSGCGGGGSGARSRP